MTPRKLTQEEITILRAYNKMDKPKIIFTEEDIKTLTEGTASFKTLSRAEETIITYRNHMRQPPSRHETLKTFLTIQEFGKYINNQIVPILDRLVIANQLLNSKKVITNLEVDRAIHIKMVEPLSSLCLTCDLNYPECEPKKRKTTGDLFPDLRPQVRLMDRVKKILRLAKDDGLHISEKVTECDKFLAKKKVEAQTHREEKGVEIQ